MANELLAAASEINLCLAGNQVEKALVAACTGLKRFLNEPQQVARPPQSPAEGDFGENADALEASLEEAALDPTGAALLSADLRVVLACAVPLPHSDDMHRIAGFA